MGERRAWHLYLDTPRRLAWATGLCTFLVLALTAPRLALVWDEGEYIVRSDQVAAWFHQVTHPGAPGGGRAAFQPASIRARWPFIDHEEGHPSWSAVPMAVAKLVTGSFLHPLTSARLGTIAVFSLACGVVAYRLRRAYGACAALFAVGAMLTMPRLFAEAHYATLDAQLTAWWLMTWAVGASTRADLRLSAAAGVLGGLSAATKFTGVLTWVPLLAGRVLEADSRRRWGALIMVPVGLVTFIAVNPPTWHHPVTAIVRHAQLNLHRTLNVPTMFLGTVYDQTRALPWYNTLVWLALTTPLPLLVLGGVGVVLAARGRDRRLLGVVSHFATLMVVRAWPGTPPHDGVRLFLPAFGFWCVLAGVGAQHVWEWARGAASRQRQRLVGGLLTASVAAGAVSVVRYYPQPLSYYNMLVGGVRGATAIGMEPTYWWDSLDREVLTWLNDHTQANERVAFAAIANVSLLRAWGWLRPVQAPRGGVFQWYVFQNRPSFLADSDRYLIANETPVFVKYAGGRRPGHVPRDLAVPLLYIYSYQQYQNALAALRGR